MAADAAKGPLKSCECLDSARAQGLRPDMAMYCSRLALSRHVEGLRCDDQRLPTGSQVAADLGAVTSDRWEAALQLLLEVDISPLILRFFEAKMGSSVLQNAAMSA